MRNRLATRDNLKARNLVIEGYDFSCPFCNSVEESVEDIWKTCYGWANVLTVLPSSPDMHFRQHQLQTNNVVNSRWQIFWYGVVWNFRNKPVFRDISSHKDEIIQQVLYHSWTWIKNSSEISIVLCSMVIQSGSMYPGLSCCTNSIIGNNYVATLIRNFYCPLLNDPLLNAGFCSWCVCTWQVTNGLVGLLKFGSEKHASWL
ncbi:hypothetical protein GmHk_18G050840 [Glycine max]|nr:hypothetical protein GmHk_18G050840 [Glycine max]